MLCRPWKKRDKRIQRVIIRYGNGRAGAHTRLSYNQTDIEVYSALNTAFQSRELKMETCENSSWVKKGAGPERTEWAPTGQRAERTPGLHRLSWGSSRPMLAGARSPPAMDLQMGHDLAGLLEIAKSELQPVLGQDTSPLWASVSPSAK